MASRKVFLKKALEGSESHRGFSKASVLIRNVHGLIGLTTLVAQRIPGAIDRSLDGFRLVWEQRVDQSRSIGHM